MRYLERGSAPLSKGLVTLVVNLQGFDNGVVNFVQFSVLYYVTLHTFFRRKMYLETNWKVKCMMK